MKVDEAISVFSSYSLAEKEEFLSHLIYELTVLMRDSYEVGGEGLTNPRRARLINEIQHRVSALLWASLRRDSQPFPDEFLVRLVMEHPDDNVLERQLGETFTRLVNQHLTVA